MTDQDLTIFFLTQCVVQLPVLIVCLVGCVMVVIKWKQLPASPSLALVGFGLAALFCLVVPAGQTFAQRWMLGNHGNMAQVGAVMTKFAFLWSVLHAVTYVLLLAAIYVGRSTLAPAVPPPLPPQQNFSPI